MNELINNHNYLSAFTSYKIVAEGLDQNDVVDGNTGASNFWESFRDGWISVWDGLTGFVDKFNPFSFLSNSGFILIIAAIAVVVVFFLLKGKNKGITLVKETDSRDRV